MTFTILGAPRTKKTSQRIVRNRRTGKTLIIASKLTKGWTKTAVEQLIAAKPHPDWPAIGRPVNCCAFIYRDRQAGDAVNYYQAIADALQDAGIVVNDRLIVSWDGSRLLLDRKRPRVELELEPTVTLGSLPLTSDHSRRML